MLEEVRAGVAREHLLADRDADRLVGVIDERQIVAGRNAPRDQDDGDNPQRLQYRVRSCTASVEWM